MSKLLITLFVLLYTSSISVIRAQPCPELRLKEGKEEYSKRHYQAAKMIFEGGLNCIGGVSEKNKIELRHWIDSCVNKLKVPNKVDSKKVVVNKSIDITVKHTNTDSINKRNIELSEKLRDYIFRVGDGSIPWKDDKDFKMDKFITKCKLIIDSGANVNYLTGDGESPLHWAVYFDFKEVTQLLIENGANVNLKDYDEKTPLSFLGESKNDPVDAANILIGKGANINLKNKSGETPLFTALNASNYNVTQSLIDAGANVNLANNKGETPLHITAIKPWMGRWSERSYDILYSLLIHNADINAKTIEGNTPLHYAAQTNNLKAALMLLDHGALINIRNAKGQTALNMAASDYGDNHQETMQVLIEKGEDINSKDYDGNTPLISAAVEGNEKDFQKLIQLKASILETNNDKQNALHASACNLNMCRILLNMGVPINAQDKYGNTPLHYSAQDCTTDDIITFLINNHADINAKNNQGETPLHLAVKEGQEKPVKALLVNGAKVNAEDNDGLTPLFYCTDEDVKKILLSYGAR